VTVIAAAESGGNFLVTPSLGLMLWTLVAFGATLWILSKLAFPRIADALDRRQRDIAGEIDAAERTRAEAEEILAQYRKRLQEARAQAEEIVERARKAADERQARLARGQRDEPMRRRDQAVFAGLVAANGEADGGSGGASAQPFARADWFGNRFAGAGWLRIGDPLGIQLEPSLRPKDPRRWMGPQLERA
jgi:hypothetical protein